MIKGMICMVLWNQGGNLEGILAGGHSVLGKKKKPKINLFFIILAAWEGTFFTQRTITLRKASVTSNERLIYRIPLAIFSEQLPVSSYNSLFSLGFQGDMDYSCAPVFHTSLSVSEFYLSVNQGFCQIRARFERHPLTAKKNAWINKKTRL